MLLFFLLAGCGPSAPPQDRLVVTPVAFSALPGWSADSIAAAVPAFLRSCPSLARRAPDSPMSRTLPEAGTMRDWQAVCTEAAGLAPGDEAAARAF
ncbi:MAG TPA: murein transglycosylase, partial [Alphaproteobacteria bacterium]|nr:murein transglycosylase [Alphaproteobacteria bacterium]